MSVGSLVIYGSPLWTFLLLVLYLLSLVSQGALLATLFDNPRITPLASNLFMACNLVVYALGALYVWGRPNTVTATWFVMLLPAVAFARGVDILGQADIIQAGITLSNVGSTEMPKVLGMLVLDVFLWYFLAWYFQLRSPGKNLQGLPPLFFLKPSYWRPSSSAVTYAESSNGEAHELVSDDIELPVLVQIPQESQNVATVSHVDKVFVSNSSNSISPLARLLFGRRKTQFAIQDVSVSLHQGQIVSVLGHNGAVSV